MASSIRYQILRFVSLLLPDSAARLLTKRSRRGLADELSGVASDKFLELLLRAMSLAFLLSKRYRTNIRDFRGRYVFRSADGLIAASVVFTDCRMKVQEQEISDRDVTVTFRTSAAFRAFIFSKDHDILDSVLRNDVDLDGNLNYIYKFGFMARELAGASGGGSSG